MTSLPPSNLSRSVFRSLENIETDPLQVNTGATRWMIPYADLLTLLLGMFMLLYALSNLDNHKLTDKIQQLNQKIPPVTKIEPKVETVKATAIKVKALTLVLQNKLGQTTGITVKQNDDGLVISLADNILFTPGNAVLNPNARQKLDNIADLLRQQPHSIRVEGHTDNSPIATSQYPSNWELSTARATHIIQYLIHQHRFNARRLSAAGYGEFHPIAKNSSIEGKQKNRRVDIVILNNR